jgi:hypothetical protein
MPSRKSMKNGKKKTKSRGRKQNCRTLRCKTGRRVNSKGYFRKKTKRKSRKTKGGGVEQRQNIKALKLEIGTYKGEYKGEINDNGERDGNGKLSLINETENENESSLIIDETENENESSLIIDGIWENDKFVDGTIYVSKKDDYGYDDYVVHMKRREMEATEQTGLQKYYVLNSDMLAAEIDIDIPPLIQSEFFVNNISEEEVEEV